MKWRKKLFGVLKDNSKFRRKHPFLYGKKVEIIYEENHPIYGTQYKIKGYSKWFDESNFKYISIITD